jgi:hypothetical protein
MRRRAVLAVLVGAVAAWGAVPVAVPDVAAASAGSAARAVRAAGSWGRAFAVRVVGGWGCGWFFSGSGPVAAAFRGVVAAGLVKGAGVRVVPGSRVCLDGKGSG